MILVRFWERLINVRVASRIVIDFFKNFINHSLCVFTRQVVKIKLIYSNRSLNLSLSLALLILTPFCLHPTLWKGHGALTASQSPLTGSRWLESCNQNGTTILFMVTIKDFLFFNFLLMNTTVDIIFLNRLPVGIQRQECDIYRFCKKPDRKSNWHVVNDNKLRLFVQNKSYAL